MADDATTTDSTTSTPETSTEVQSDGVTSSTPATQTQTQTSDATPSSDSNSSVPSSSDSETPTPSTDSTPAVQTSEPELPVLFYVTLNDAQIERTIRAYKGARKYHADGDKDQASIDEINRLIYYICQVTGKTAEDDSGIHDIV